MKKRLLALLACFVLLLTCATVALAEEQRVFDYAQVMDASAVQQLEETIAAQRQQTGLDWVILTVDDAGGSTAREVAEEFYLQNDVGVGSDYSGVLFLIDFDNSEIYIATCGKGIDYITDSRREAIFDQCFDQVAVGEYAQAAAIFLEEGQCYVSLGVPEDHYYVDEETGEITRYRAPLSLFSVVLFALAAAVIALVFRFGVTRGYSIKASGYAYPFMNKSRLALAQQQDRFQNRFVSTRRIPRNNSSGGSGRSSGGSSGGGSRVHSSGGRSFGGGGRKF